LRENALDFGIDIFGLGNALVWCLRAVCGSHQFRDWRSSTTLALA